MSTRGADDAACVLVVDDEEDIREALREAIELTGCRAITAANGAVALEKLRTWRPCLVILDLRMPVMTGLEMLAAMQKDPELAALRVVVSTSAPGRAPAGIPVLPKPIDIEKLFGWVRRACTCDRATASSA